MKNFLLMIAVVGGAACATAPKPSADTASSADRAAVIAAVQSLFDAMRTRDTAAIRSTFAPSTSLVSIRTTAGEAPRIQVQPVSAFITSIGSATQELVERMWDPRVEVAGDMASLWAPYDFRIGSTFSHCGHDAVHLARTAAGWKVVGITYTVQRTGCAAP